MAIREDRIIIEGNVSIGATVPYPDGSKKAIWTFSSATTSFCCRTVYKRPA